MKILFAINQDSSKTIEKTILTAYQNKYGEQFEYSSEFYVDGAIRQLNEEQYDILVLKHDLDAEEVPLKVLDTLTDLYNDLRIILIFSDNYREDSFPKQLFSLGLYDCIYESDWNIEYLANLIHKGRDKKAAKLYYGFGDLSEVELKIDNMQAISDEELERVLSKFEEVPDEEVINLFLRAKKSYNFKEMVYLVSMMNDRLKGILEYEEEYQPYKKELERYIESLNTKTIEVEKEVVKEKVVEVEKIVEVEVEKVIEKEVVREIYKTPTDYKKVIGFTGTNNAGTTTIIEQIAYTLAENNVKVAILDLCKNKDLYERHIYSSSTPVESLEQLTRGQVAPNEIKNNVHLFTNAPDNYVIDETDTFNFIKIINLVKSSYDVVLIDSDRNSTELFTLVDKMVFVVSQDVTEVKDLTKYLVRLKEKHSDFELKMKNSTFIINKYIKHKSITKCERLIHCYATEVNYLDTNLNKEIFDKSQVDYFTVAASEEVLINNYSDNHQAVIQNEEYQSNIKAITEDIYPLNNTNIKVKSKGIFGFFRKGE